MLRGDAGRRVGRQPQRLVERVRVQTLRTAQHRGHRLIGGAHDVVVRVLLGQRHAGRLTVSPQHERRRILRIELLDDPMPQQAGRPQLGDLHEEVHADTEEEAEPAGERVDVEPAVDGVAHVLEPIGDRERELLIGGRARFEHVVAGDRDRVEPRHVLRGVLDDVRNDPHRRLGRIDVGVAHHELFEDVVLDGAVELGLLDALFFTGDDERREHGQHRAVHRHRHGHLVEGDAVEQDLHVFDGVDGDARLADVADDAWMVAVVTAVRREVECDRQAHLAGGEVASIEGVGLLGRGEACVLPDRPRSVGVHRRPHAPDERRQAR